jgi:hypothetical protein
MNVDTSIVPYVYDNLISVYPDVFQNTYHGLTVKANSWTKLSPSHTSLRTGASSPKSSTPSAPA